MPEIVEGLPQRRSSGRTSRYPWDVWLDGESRLFVTGQDFESKPASFVTTAYAAAKARGVKIASRVRDEGVYIQAIGPADEDPTGDGDTVADDSPVADIPAVETPAAPTAEPEAHVVTPEDALGDPVPAQDPAQGIPDGFAPEGVFDE